MSSVHVSIVRSSSVSAADPDSPMAVEDSDSLGTAETLTSGAGQAVTTLAFPTGASPEQYAWRIANMGTDNVYVAFGAAPTASAAGKGIPAGAVAYFGVRAVGDKVAVTNV